MSNYQLKVMDMPENIEPVEELKYEPVEREYRNVQMFLCLIGYLCLAGVALLLLFLDNRLWCLLMECLILTALSLNLIILRKAWSFKGYALREHDISYRSGIIFPKVTTIPYDRMQQVSIKQNPVAKALHLYAVEVVNGAQAMASLSIPGLKEEMANQIKMVVIGRMRDGRD